MRFSIVTITYNVEKVIDQTIKSIFNQNFTDYEYIFIDGNSKDRTNEIIESYRSSFEEKNIIFSHYSEPDKGISDAFSKGVKKARGEIVVILNAGDEMLPHTLEFLDKNFQDDIDVLYGNMIWHDDIKGIKYIKKSKEPKYLNELKYNMVIKHPATYIKKRAYDKFGLYDLSFKYAMDTDLLLRMYRGGARFKYVDREFTYFMAGGESDSHLVSVLKENARIARKAGEPRGIIAIHILKKYIHHHLAHFVRLTILRK